MLLNSLNQCCKPNISLSCTATCAGLDSSGNATYNIVASATYNISIAGYTSLIGYISSQPFPDMTKLTDTTLNNLNIASATIFVNNIAAGSPCVMANLSAVDGMTPGTYYAMVTDNRGNYASPMTITFPNCQ